MVNILVVDDEKSMRRTLSIALQDDGYEVMEAANGKEALEYINNEVFDIVITDLVMDDIDGIELLRNIKEVNPITEVLL
ncbi:MAG: response regulator, partial [bacterium]